MTSDVFVFYLYLISRARNWLRDIMSSAEFKHGTYHLVSEKIDPISEGWGDTPIVNFR